MAELLRTNLSAPPVALDRTGVTSSAGKTSRALGQLAELGSVGVQLYTKENEVKMANLAMNDLVNDSINPDLERHEAAYARVVTEGRSLKTFSTMQKEVADGKYNKLNPEKFQELILDQHNKAKEVMAKSKYSDHIAATYDKFWLKNESTITAGQAGMYRKDLEFSQNRAMLAAMSTAAKTSGITAEKILEIGYNPDYSMVDEGTIIQNALTAGIDSGSIEVLENLNEKLHFSNDPARAPMYNAAIKTMEKLDRVQNKELRAKVYNEILQLSSQNKLTLDIYFDNIKDNEALKDEHGNDLMTEKEFVNLMWKGNVGLDRTKAQNTVTMRTESGTLTNNETTAQINTAYGQLHEKYDYQKVDVVTKAGIMGRIVKAAPVVDPHYKNLSSHWSNMDSVNKDGSINDVWKLNFYVLRAFKDTAGDRAFWKHLNEEAASDFRIAENAFKYGSQEESTEERLQLAATQSDKIRKNRESGKRLNIKTTDPEVVTAVDDVTDAMYKWYEYLPLIGKDRGDTFSDQSVKSLLAQEAADLLNNGLATYDTLEEALEQVANNRIEVIGGNLQDTQGENTALLFGGDPDHALNSYADLKDIDIDPDQYRVILDVNNGNINIRDINDTNKEDRVIPLAVLKRYSLSKTMTATFRGDHLSKEETLDKYKRFSELDNLSLEPTTSRIGPVVGPKALLDADQHKNALLYMERRDIQSYLHLQDDLNEQYFAGYIEDIKPQFDYDLDKVTPEQWGKMTPEEKTGTRLDSVDEWMNGNDTVQKALDTIIFNPVSESVVQSVDPRVQAIKDTVRSEENTKRVSTKTGWTGEVWESHTSAEGGNDTVAYGHKLTGEEIKSGTINIDGTEYKYRKDESEITDNVAIKLFNQDWDAARELARSKWTDFDNMSARNQALITELAFNVKDFKQSKWPKLDKAIKDSADKDILDNIMRSYTDAKGKKVPLKKRVEAIRNAAV